MVATATSSRHLFEQLTLRRFTIASDTHSQLVLLLSKAIYKASCAFISYNMQPNSLQSMSPLWFPALQDEYFEPASSQEHACWQCSSYSNASLCSPSNQSVSGTCGSWTSNRSFQLDNDLCCNLTRLSLDRVVSDPVSIATGATDSCDCQGRSRHRHSSHKAMDSTDFQGIIQRLFNDDDSSLPTPSESRPQPAKQSRSER